MLWKDVAKRVPGERHLGCVGTMIQREAVLYISLAAADSTDKQERPGRGRLGSCCPFCTPCPPGLWRCPSRRASSQIKPRPSKGTAGRPVSLKDSCSLKANPREQSHPGCATCRAQVEAAQLGQIPELAAAVVTVCMSSHSGPGTSNTLTSNPYKEGVSMPI